MVIKGVKINFSGSVQKYLEEMRTYGKCTMKFKMTNEFREFFQIKEKSITFKTHEQLDNFVSKLGPEFKENYP